MMAHSYDFILLKISGLKIFWESSEESNRYFEPSFMKVISCGSPKSSGGRLNHLNQATFQSKSEFLCENLIKIS